jgi:N-methylhydantoinase A
VRIRLTGFTPKPRTLRQPLTEADASAARTHWQSLYFRGGRHRVPVYERGRLRPGNRFVGPAIVSEYSATTFLPPRWRGRVDAAENLILEPTP